MSKVLKLQTTQIDVAEHRKSIPVHAIVVPDVHLTEANEDAFTADDLEQLVAEAQQQAESLLADAHARAEQILVEATTGAEDVRTQAHREGYEAGYAQGVENARTEMETMFLHRVSEADSLLSHANEERVRLLKDMHLPLTNICMQVVRQLLLRELNTQSVDIEQMVSHLLQYVIESAKIEVRVHPDDYQSATEAHPTWTSAKFGDWEVVVVPDANLSRGGCEIRSDAGQVDATIETKLEFVQDTLTSVMERGVAEYVATLGQ